MGMVLRLLPRNGAGRISRRHSATFDQARAELGEAWPIFLAKRTDADFTAYRQQRAFTGWKYAMWDAGCKMPTQVPELRSRCFCGAEIGLACEEHVYQQHMEAA